MITTGVSNVTIDVKPGGCQHPELFLLGCEEHDYEHTVGYGCHDCYEQFFYPSEVWCA